VVVLDGEKGGGEDDEEGGGDLEAEGGGGHEGELGGDEVLVLWATAGGFW